MHALLKWTVMASGALGLGFAAGRALSYVRHLERIKALGRALERERARARELDREEQQMRGEATR